MVQLHPSLDIARAIFCDHVEIEAVYLFGSVATGKAHQESDLDFGVRFTSVEAALPKLSLLTELAAAGFDRVDLVYLHEADPTLRYEIVRHNHLLYAVEGFDRGTVYSNTLRRFFDLQPLLALQRAAVKERMINGAS